MARSICSKANLLRCLQTCFIIGRTLYTETYTQFWNMGHANRERSRTAQNLCMKVRIITIDRPGSLKAGHAWTLLLSFDSNDDWPVEPQKTPNKWIDLPIALHAMPTATSQTTPKHQHCSLSFFLVLTLPHLLNELSFPRHIYNTLCIHPSPIYLTQKRNITPLCRTWWRTLRRLFSVLPVDFSPASTGITTTWCIYDSSKVVLSSSRLDFTRGHP